MKLKLKSFKYGQDYYRILWLMDEDVGPDQMLCEIRSGGNKKGLVLGTILADISENHLVIKSRAKELVKNLKNK